MSDNERVDCMKCRHFYVTWDPKFPKGCKAFGFKSPTMPSIAVRNSSGKACFNFEPKAPR
ncbi:uracil-DNA glycosylase [Cohnella endophytica]|uniref:Uracil-DNA glycosylase n=1 Tax=Cohnella endophytica TaxID=2419778 RepID=A0A494Y8W1_9BACL|nr:uracil-DNA glycosylase [Cohnella endophytica]RKP58038.1 uracil-DNA glycosylase [Cohnella endophytica]